MKKNQIWITVRRYFRGITETKKVLRSRRVHSVFGSAEETLRQLNQLHKWHRAGVTNRKSNVIHDDRCTQLLQQRRRCKTEPNYRDVTTNQRTGRSLIRQSLCASRLLLCLSSWVFSSELTMWRLRQSTSAVSWCRLISVVFRIPWISSKLPWK